MKGFLKEYMSFIRRGNILDLAVAVIVGAAFTKIVTSLTNDIIMPLITFMLGETSLDSLSIVLRDETATGGAVLLFRYGAFLQAIVDFLIIALIIFIMVRFIKRLQKKLDINARMTTAISEKLNKDEPLSKSEIKWMKAISKIDPALVPKKKVPEPPKPIVPSKTEVLLTEILKELQNQKQAK